MPKLQGLQMLRAFAAVMVLIGHSIAEAEHYFQLSFNADLIPWTRGVDIFFVVSGFIITISAQRYANRPAAFMWRRFLRVAPLYYIFTTLMVIMLLVLPNGPKDTTLDWGQVISSYGFFPFAREDGRIAPVLSLGWTLNYEVFFYAIFAFALMFGRLFMIACAALLCLSSVGAILSFESPQLVFWTNPILMEFLYGMILAKLYLAGWHRPDGRWAMMIFSLGIIWMIYLHSTQWPRYIAAGIPAAMIVSAGTLFYQKQTPYFQVLGDASYALYLSHRFTLRAMTILILPALPDTTTGAFMYLVTVIIASIGIAILVHLWLERPLLYRTNKAART
jgi:exopolysaccharide production protein ExoZ